MRFELGNAVLNEVLSVLDFKNLWQPLRLSLEFMVAVVQIVDESRTNVAVASRLAIPWLNVD